jgi:hypothetical protein
MIWTCNNKLVSSRYFTNLRPAKRDTFGANGALDIGVLDHAESDDGYVYNRRLDAEVQIPKVRENSTLARHTVIFLAFWTNKSQTKRRESI